MDRYCTTIPTEFLPQYCYASDTDQPAKLKCVAILLYSIDYAAIAKGY